MGYRAPRLYSWREVQELARELQSMRRASHVDVKTTDHRQHETTDQLLSTSMTPEGELHDVSQSRIVRVERLKAEHASKNSERLDDNKSPTRSSPTHSFNSQAFKAAWRAGQREATHHSSLNEVSVPMSNLPQSSDSTPIQTVQPQGVDRAFNDRAASRSAKYQESTRTRVSGESPSPWDLLRDHFVAQHRLYQAQREQREQREQCEQREADRET